MLKKTRSGPKGANELIKLSDVAARKGNDQLALDYANRALRIADSFEAPTFAIASIMRRQGKPDQALVLFASMIANSTSQYWVAWGHIMSAVSYGDLGDYTSAI